MTAAVETIAMELSRRPSAGRGGDVVMLMTQIDGELRVQHPDWTDGQRGAVVLQISRDVITRAIEIDRENAGRRPVQRVLL
jgi:hypothetical protein